MKKKAYVIFALLCTVAQWTWAQNEQDYSKSFVWREWNDDTKTVVENVEYSSRNATVTESTSFSGGWLKFEENDPNDWFFDGKITLKCIHVISGNMHMILRDGAVVTVEHIKLEGDASLEIHPQQGLNGDIGKLVVKDNSYEGAAGIGGGDGASAGELVIHGGNISVKNYQDYGAGIGGGKNGNGGKVTIYGGTVNVMAFNGGAAIGGGYGGNGGDVKIYGGDLTLESGSTGGYSSSTYCVTIGRGEGGSSDGTLTLGNMKTFRGDRGPGFINYDDVPVNYRMRNTYCKPEDPVKMQLCEDHMFAAGTCGYCGYHSDEAPKGITYIDRTWDEATKKIVEKEVTVEDAVNLMDVIADPVNYRQTTFREVPLEPQILGDNVDYGVNITSRTVYIAPGKIDLTHYTLYAGGTNLIICDGAEADVHHIIINDMSDIRIYGEKNEAGKLTVNEARSSNARVEFLPSRQGDAGIGASGQFGGGQIYIHSGNITAYGSEGAPAIGNQTGADFGRVWIYGGTIVADGSVDTSCGISCANSIRIYGGDVTARGGSEATGIGGEPEYLVQIFGGNVHAYGGEDAAGIGGSRGRYSKMSLGFLSWGGANVEISGGTVYAEGAGWAAGIGAGRATTEYSHKTTVTISGGDVTAKGGKYAAGIGGGINNHGGTITISGGTIHAYGGVDAAGIGGGEDGNSGDITISGGTIYAESTGEDSYGAGIGAGEDGFANTIEITGGTVYAKGGSAAESFAIGSNLSDGKGVLTLDDHLKVEAGSSESDIERRFTAFERKGACWYRKYAVISECTHETPLFGSDRTPAISYTILDEGHNVQCRYCNYSEVESHDFQYEINGAPCQKCGKEFNADDDLWTITIYQANTSNTQLAWDADYDGGTQYSVVKGQSFNMPILTKTAEGLSMMALVKDPETAPGNIWLTDAEIADPSGLFDPSQPFTPTQDTKIYARYRLAFTTNWEWNEDEFGFIDPEKVEMSFSNPLLYDGNEQYIQAEFEIHKNSFEDDITYTATVTYPYQYPEGLTGVTYTFTDVKHTPYFTRDIKLYDNAKNSSTIYDYEGKIVNATLSGRTFSHDGCWNTIYLPFALSADQLADEECPLHGATIKQLKDAWFEDGTLTLTFNDTTAIKAGMPYIVKWPEGDDVTDPVFKNVTPSSDLNQTFFIKDKDGNRPENEEDLYFGLLFTGSWNPSELTDDIVQTKQLLYMGADSKLYYPTEPMTIGAFQCYFHLYGITADDLEENPVKNVVFNFGDETGITTTNVTNLANEADAWYDLSGRRLNSRPTTKGIYIQNGRKMMIK